MRHLLSILLILFVVTSCDKDTPKQLLDPNTQLSINVVSGTTPRAESDEGQPISPLEVVKQADAIHLIGYGYDNDCVRKILDKQRDFDGLSIRMFGNDIISESPRSLGQLHDFFIRAKDVYFTTVGDADTIAYVPNRVVQEAYPKVLAAYEAGDYPEVYRLFQQAYKAIPCTSKQFKELKEKGLN